jgi:SAM-dependent methyltransferase
LRTLVEKLLPPSRATTVIDVGCGTGANLAYLDQKYRGLGIDTSADAIRLARKRFPGVEFIKGYAPADLGHWIDDARLITCMDVLEHVPDDFSLFSSLVAAVQPGTIMLITVPAEPRLWARHDESYGHYRRYETRRLVQIWEGLPIEPLMVSHFNSRLYPVIRAVRTVNRWRGNDRVVGRDGTDMALPAPPANRVLESIFAGESRTLCRALDGRGRGYRRGVSLMAVLRRLPGVSEMRGKPAGLAADLYDPVAHRPIAVAG